MRQFPMSIERLRQKFRIWRHNRAYRRWHQKYPDKKFHDFYAERIVAGIESGKWHTTIGANLKNGRKFDDEDQITPILIEHGLKEHHVCADYGCGSLRYGQHIMRYLQPESYWGLDITDKFYKIGLGLIDPALIEEKKPNLRIISQESLDEVRARRPSIVVSIEVLAHVPEFELDEYLSRVMSLLSEDSLALITCKLADKYSQISARSWCYPEKMLEQAIQRHGGRVEFLPQWKAGNGRPKEVRPYHILLRKVSSILG